MPSQKLNRVVVVGNGGFVGHKITEKLEVSGVPNIGTRSRDLDLVKPDSVQLVSDLIKDGDSVVFVSALTPDKGKDLGTLEKNVAMVQHFLAGVKTKKLNSVVYVSSDAVYNDAETLIHEGTLAAPSSFHGVMHLAREIAFRDWAKASGNSLCVLRPSAVYGPGDTHNSYGPNRFLRSAILDTKISLFGGADGKRDHLFIDDFVNIVERCLVEQKCGTINVVSGQPASFMQVATWVRELVGPQVGIEEPAEKGVSTHRSFDSTQLIKQFPNLVLTPFYEGLRKSMSHLRSM